MQKKEFPPAQLKNIWLEHKNDLYFLPDLIDLEIPWSTIDLISKTSSLITDDRISSINIAASSQLLRFDHDENDSYAKLDGCSMTVGRGWFTVTLWTSYAGDEVTTMDIPINALLQGMFCIRIEDGKVVEPTDEDRECFNDDEWEYVIAPTLEIAATKCTHKIETSAFDSFIESCDMPQ